MKALALWYLLGVPAYYLDLLLSYAVKPLRSRGLCKWALSRNGWFGKLKKHVSASWGRRFIEAGKPQ